MYWTTNISIYLNVAARLTSTKIINFLQYFYIYNYQGALGSPEFLYWKIWFGQWRKLLDSSSKTDGECCLNFQNRYKKKSIFQLQIFLLQSTRFLWPNLINRISYNRVFSQTSLLHKIEIWLELFTFYIPFCICKRSIIFSPGYLLAKIISEKSWKISDANSRCHNTHSPFVSQLQLASLPDSFFFTPWHPIQKEIDLLP